MDICKTPVGPLFKKTDLKAGMRIKFPYQDQQYTGTIDGFEIVEGREIFYVDGIAYRWSELDLRPVYTVLSAPEVKPEIKLEVKPKKKEKKIGFKLVKKKKK